MDLDTHLLTPRRVALVVLAAVLIALAVAPVLMLDPPPRDGRAGLARYRAIQTGAVDVTAEFEADLRAGFAEDVRADGTVRLVSADDDGRCWQLLLPDVGDPQGPSPAPDQLCDRSDRQERR